MTISAGENVGPYRVIAQLGSGGMATVFKAYHPALDRYVAIKVLHAAFKADPQFFERFQREARIIAKLEHPHIIPVYDFNEHHGEPYLVMRFVEGDTFKPKLGNGAMSPDEVLQFMRPVCQALSYAHQQGVLHRDLKPSNMMVSKEGHVFLTDFGLARMVQAGESTLSQDMMIGTPQYISPEQALGVKELDGRTDIYSLGVVLYEMFTGQVPFNADTPFATIHDHIYTALPLPSKINPGIDPAVERLLLKALAKDPTDRYPNADELFRALETTLVNQKTVSKTAPVVAAPSRTTLVGPSPRPTPWWVYVGGAALAVCLVAALVGGIWLWRRSHTAPPAPGQAQPAPVVATVPPDTPPPAQPSQPLAENQAALPGSQPGAPSPDPNNPASQPAAELTRQANEVVKQQKLDQAVRLYEQAVAADPHYLPAYLGWSNALRQQGNLPGSIAVLEQAVAQNPNNPDLYIRLGEAQLTSDQAKAAVLSFDQAIALAPGSAGAYARKALALLNLDRNQEAKQAIDTALSLDSTNPESRLANAIYLARQGQRRQALVELQQLLQDRHAPPFVVQRTREFLAQLQR
jgi:serine/threonine protein kinase